MLFGIRVRSFLLFFFPVWFLHTAAAVEMPEVILGQAEGSEDLPEGREK